MPKEDLAKGLKAIEADDVRTKVAAGDIGAAGELDLTEEEAALLRSAAEDPDYPEVAGFAFESYVKIDVPANPMEPHSLGSTGAGPGEDTSLNFGKIDWDYKG